MSVEVYDTRTCSLGEGPLWHPERKQLFWFDINNRKMLSRSNGEPQSWQFDEYVSAAGWIGQNELLIASETGLFSFDLVTQKRRELCELESENSETRSNDGRADPWGGFWIGTMGKSAEPEAGAIYRFFAGKITKLYSDITISNSICFSPDKKYAYFTDTVSRKILRQPLDAEGWPAGESELFVDLRVEGLNPDGSVVDSDGCLWNAQWGASRVARYSPNGEFLSAITLPSQQATCPAFGGDNLKTLFVTSASEGLSAPSDAQGKTFQVPLSAFGQPENQVKL